MHIGSVSASVSVYSNDYTPGGQEIVRIPSRLTLTLWNPRATTVDSPPFFRPDYGRP